MQPVNFPEATTKLAKNQPQFRPLPVCIQKVDPNTPAEHLQFTFKYALSDLEIEQIIKTRSFYFSQFGNCFHPVFASIESQFGACPVQFRKCLDIEDANYYDFWIPLNDGTIHEIKNCLLSNVMERVVEVTQLRPDQILFVEKPSVGVDEKGNIVGL